MRHWFYCGHMQSPRISTACFFPPPVLYLGVPMCAPTNVCASRGCWDSVYYRFRFLLLPSCVLGSWSIVLFFSSTGFVYSTVIRSCKVFRLLKVDPSAVQYERQKFLLVCIFPLLISSPLIFCRGAKMTQFLAAKCFLFSSCVIQEVHFQSCACVRQNERPMCDN